MDSPLIPTSSPESAPPEPSSLLDRLTGVITGPGEVFAELKDAPVNYSNWLVPLILVCLAGILYVGMAMSQPAVQRGFIDAREKAMQKQVALGKLTQAQADQASAMSERFMTPTLMTIFGSGGAIIASAMALFLLAFTLWLALKLGSGSAVDYMKIVEVCGLALVIDVPQKVIRTWLVTWKENMLATVSPTLFLANPDMHSKRDLFLSMIDPIDIWWLSVLSLGISKVASVSFRTSAFVCFGLWFGFRVVMVLLTPPQ